MAITNAAKDRRRLILEGVVKMWNKTHPVGTEIVYWPGVMEGPGRESTVRSEAWILPSGIAVAKVEGYAGGIALTHIGFRSEAQALAAEQVRDGATGERLRGG
jgi:hypothetical protein